MATKQIKKLSDLQKITTATGDQMIPVVDASGNVNPIKLTDLAQVVAELIGTASVSKDGLLSASIYRKVLQYNSFSNSANYRIGYLPLSFTGFLLIGVETAYCEFISICVSKNNRNIICSNKPNYANLKVDSEGYIYFSVNTGWSIDALLIGANTAIIMQDPPSDAVDIEVAE